MAELVADFGFDLIEMEAQARRRGPSGSGAGRSLEERGWQAWLDAIFPHIFTEPLAEFHREFWDWYWSALLAKRDRQPFPEGNAFFAVWSRGFAKSTHARIAPIAEAALLGKGYCLYLSNVQAQANKHLQSIENLLLSERVAHYYPELSRPRRGVAGRSSGWRQEFIHTDAGYILQAVGLDVGVRGANINSQRPSLIVPDDVDSREDSPAVAAKNLETFTRSILPAGEPRTIIISAQNLIHRHGIVNQIVTGRVKALSNRKVSGPHPAVRNLKTEARSSGGAARDVIVSGEPTWARLGIPECQEFIDNSGLKAFLAEYQHDLKAAQQGVILPEFDEAVHVITWSEFREVFKVKRIPDHWRRYVGHDWGSTGDDAHACVVSFLATSAENSKLPGVHFLYAGLTFPESTLADEVARAVVAAAAGVEAPPERAAAAIKADFAEWQRKHGAFWSWQMSHEAKSPRDVYHRVYGLPFQACNPRASGGIEQMRHYLRVDYTQPHPFKPGAMGAAGWYWVVG